MNFKNQYSVFFVNKYSWIDKNPMTTISTFSTYALSELVYQTTLIVSGNEQIEYESILKNYYGLTPKNNYQVKIIKRPNLKIFNSSILFYIKATKFILKNKTNKTIVITRNTTYLPYLVLLRFFGIITLFESHGYHGKLSPANLPKRKETKLVNASTQYHLYERLFLNKVNGLLCITTPQMHLYQQDFLKDLPSAKSLFNRKKIIYIGRYTNHIDVKILFAALQKTNKKINFIWLGLKENDFDTLNKYISEYSMQDRVELKGWVGHQEMQKFILTNASIGLALYKNTFRSAAITSPSKIFDYFSLGLPVLAPDMANIRGIIENETNGLLFSPSDASSLASQIEYIFSNYEIFDKLRRASIRSSDNFSWNTRAQSLIQFIENLET